MAKKRRRQIDSSKEQQVPIEYYGIEEVDIKYMDGLTVQHDENGFVVSFFQAEHPLALTEEARAKIRKVRTKCIVRLFIPPAVFEVTLDALQRNFEKYKALYIIEDEDDAKNTDKITGQGESK